VFLGAFIYYIAATTVKTSVWTAEVDGKTIVLSPNAEVETKNTAPFAPNIEKGSNSYYSYSNNVVMCNCIVDIQDNEPGDLESSARYGKVQYSWKVPQWKFPEDFDTFQSIRFQTLIRQRVTYTLETILTLDWYIHIDGYISKDGKNYFLILGGKYQRPLTDGVSATVDRFLLKFVIYR
jgi:hypothetical protein